MTFPLTAIKKALALVAIVIVVGGTAVLPVVAFAQETPTPPTSTTPPAEATTESADENAYKFIPLTTLPGLEDIAEAGDNPSAGLSGFFNTLYRLCIGAAAIIAVIQIMRAGFKIITNKGSFSQNEEAKSLIGNTILGILLVLSPVIVFSIINPRILDLEFDFSSLSSTRENPADNVPVSTNGTPICSEQYTDIRSIPESSMNRYSGYATLSPSCCQIEANTTNKCVGRLKTNKFTVAGYYIRTNTSTNFRCYNEIRGQYDTEAQCQQFLRDFRAGTLTGSVAPSNVTLQLSCVPAPQNFTVTPPAEVQKCS